MEIRSIPLGIQSIDLLTNNPVRDCMSVENIDPLANNPVGIERR